MNDALNGYEVALVAKPAFPAWARAIGLEPVQVHASMGSAVRILHRTDR